VEQPLLSRLDFAVNLPLTTQKIEFLRSFISQVEKNIAPNLWRANLLKGTLLERLE